MNNLRSPRNRRRRLQRNESRDVSSLSPPASSPFSTLLSTLLLIGLAFCLADVAYILHFIDHQQESNSMDGALESVSSLSRSSWTGKAPSSSSWWSSLTFFHNDAGLSLDEYQALIQFNQLHSKQMFQNHYSNTHDSHDSHAGYTSSWNQTQTPLTQQELQFILTEKKPILSLLAHAKIPIAQLDPQTLRELPTWKQVTNLYGDAPRIWGINEGQCTAFQTHSDPALHFLSTAGAFNSGTNLMAELLIHNCQMTARVQKYGASNPGIRWQVPWGKHNPPGNEDFRLHHKTLKSQDVDPTNIMPAVTIRDPYVWMNSMCHIQYSAHWHHDPNRHCPNLIPDTMDLVQFGKFLKEGQPVPIHVKYNGFWKHYDSLVGMWNTWYREYYDGVPFQRVMVRYEDLLFFPYQVTQAVCACAGGELRTDRDFQYIVKSAKKGETAHGPMELRTGYLQALIHYGKATHRSTRYLKADLEYARQHLDTVLMEYFGYKHPDELMISDSNSSNGSNSSTKVS